MYCSIVEQDKSIIDETDTAHSSWVEINLKALRDNIIHIKSLLPPKTKIMAVVKANAYGHGLVKIAKAALTSGADHLGVATLNEGTELRASGITAPILVLGCLLPEQLPKALKHNLQVIISNLENLYRFQFIANSLNKIAEIHLKIDTGMGRIGLFPEQAIPIIEAIPSLPNLQLNGICTHFAMSEDPTSFYTKLQFQRFQTFIQDIESKIPLPTLHVANSSAVLLHQETHLDMVRVGLAMYGVSEAGNIILEPVLSLKAKVTQIRELPSGTPVGYGCNYITDRPTKIALIPVGYADGIPRSLSNRQEVLIHGQRCPIIGNISMDQCTIDITDLEVSIGDEVVLLGKQKNKEISVKEWAKKANLIPYEILCHIANRLSRLYI